MQCRFKWTSRHMRNRSVWKISTQLFIMFPSHLMAHSIIHYRISSPIYLKYDIFRFSLVGPKPTVLYLCAMNMMKIPEFISHGKSYSVPSCNNTCHSENLILTQILRGNCTQTKTEHVFVRYWSRSYLHYFESETMIIISILKEIVREPENGF